MRSCWQEPRVLFLDFHIYFPSLFASICQHSSLCCSCYYYLIIITFSFLAKVCTRQITTTQWENNARPKHMVSATDSVHMLQVYPISSMYPGNNSGQQILYVYAWALSVCYWSPVVCQWDVNTVSFNRKLQSIQAAVNNCYTENTGQRHPLVIKSAHTARLCVRYCGNEPEVNIPFKLTCINKCMKNSHICTACRYKLSKPSHIG